MDKKVGFGLGFRRFIGPETRRETRKDSSGQTPYTTDGPVHEAWGRDRQECNV